MGMGVRVAMDHDMVELDLLRQRSLLRLVRRSAIKMSVVNLPLWSDYVC